jgi:hypothetical protein
VYRRVVNRDTSLCYQISTPYYYYLNNSQIQITAAKPPAYQKQVFRILKYLVRIFELEYMKTDFGCSYDLMRH